MAIQTTDSTRDSDHAGLLSQTIREFSGLSEHLLAVLCLADRAQKMRDQQPQNPQPRSRN